MKLILSYLKEHKKLLGLALILAAVNQIFSMLDPQLFRLIIDNYASRVGELSQAEFLRGVGLLLLGIIGVAFVSRTAKAFQDYYANVVSESVGAEMYADSVRHVFSLPYRAFEDERSGSILLNLQKARDNTKELIQNFINVVFFSAVGIIFVIAYAFWVHWMVAVTFLLIIPVVATTAFYLSRSIKPAQREVVKESAELSGATTETLRNVSLVKSLGLEEQEVDRLNRTNDKVLDLELEKVILLRKLSYIQGTLINAVRALLTFVMLYLIFQGAITLGEFISLFFYNFLVFNPLTNISDVVASYQQAQASSQELERILSIEADTESREGERLSLVESITFEEVSFSYDEAHDRAVNNISFEASQGETIAFVGPSGSGKSTLIKLMVGLYRPDEGMYRINNHDRVEVDMQSFKKRIGFVSQETQVFAGTIRENLHFVAPDASDEELTEALEQAQVGYILDRGDEEVGTGLDAKIGETGIKLSGGERQRLSIARALLRNPDVLIFDEATSSLDTITERAITETIEEIRKQRPELILVLVAHRLSTVTSADRIYVLKHGEVEEHGSKDELLKHNGLFSLLWHQQALTSESSV